MSDSSMQKQSSDDEKLPFMQRLLDNPFALLAIGVFAPMILYIVWGMVELTQVPLAP